MSWSGRGRGILREAARDRLHSAVNFPEHFLLTDTPQWVRDQRQRQVREASIPGLEPGELDKLVGADDDRGNSSSLQQDGAVDTPRRARSSVGGTDQDEVAAGEIGHDLG
jgi:hypothetical protein